MAHSRSREQSLRYGQPLYLYHSTNGMQSTGLMGTGNFVSLDPGGTSFIHVMDTDFPTDVMLLYSRLFVIGEDGKEVGIDQGIYPHHVVFISPSRFAMDDILSCNGRTMKVPTIPTFIGTSAEIAENRYTNRNATVDTGYYLPKGEKIAVQIDIVNYKEYDQNIYIVPEIEYIAGKPKGYLDSSEYIISPNTCDSILGVLGGTLVKPPPGVKKFSLNGTDMTFEKDGYIVWSRELYSKRLTLAVTNDIYRRTYAW
jgi:hypothetical protein